MANLSPSSILSSSTAVPTLQQTQLFSFNYVNFICGPVATERREAETQLYLQGGGNGSRGRCCLCVWVCLLYRCVSACACIMCMCAHVNLRTVALAFWCLLCADHLLWAVILLAGFCQKSYIYPYWWSQHTKRNLTRIWATFQPVPPSLPTDKKALKMYGIYANGCHAGHKHSLFSIVIILRKKN